MVRSISCWVVGCSLVSSVPLALVGIPADKEVILVWFGLVFWFKLPKSVLEGL